MVHISPINLKMTVMASAFLMAAAASAGASLVMSPLQGKRWLKVSTVDT